MPFRGEGIQNRHTLNFALEVPRKLSVARAGWQRQNCQTIPFRHGQQREQHGGTSQGRTTAMPNNSSPLRAPQCEQNARYREGRRGPLGDPLFHSFQSLAGGLVIFNIEFHAEILATC